MSMYEIISYDVWGNEQDGFQVNDLFHTGREVWILGDDPEFPDDAARDASLATVCADYFPGWRLEEDTGAYSEDTIYLSEIDTGRPVTELRRIPGS